MAIKAFEKIKETELEAEQIRQSAVEEGIKIRKRATDESEILVKNETQKANDSSEKEISKTAAEVNSKTEKELEDYSKVCNEIKNESMKKVSSALEEHIEHLLNR